MHYRLRIKFVIWSDVLEHMSILLWRKILMKWKALKTCPIKNILIRKNILDSVEKEFREI